MLRKPRDVLLTLFVVAVASCLLFLLWGVNVRNYGFNIPLRAVKLAAFVLTGSALGFSTVAFQTIAHSRILTPSIMGLDSLYMFVQTLMIFVLGSGQLAMMSRIGDFLLSVTVMTGFALLLFTWIFRGDGRNLFTVMLAGIVCGSFFGSLSTFMQVVIDPNEFLFVQDRMFASFNSVNRSLLGVSTVVLCVLFACGYTRVKQLDVIALGRDIAINLGVPYDKTVRNFMVMISVMTAVSTALVGPVTFLGLLTANVSRQVLKTWKHDALITGAILVSVTSLAFGQFIVERILTFNTTISVTVNFIGGVYFIYLLLREGRI
jgi:iron complex transport system permease protein